MEAGSVLLLVLRKRTDAFHGRGDRSILLEVDEDLQADDGRSVEPLDRDFDALVPLRLADPLEPVGAAKIVVVDFVQLADDLMPGSGRRDETRNFARTEQVQAVALL